MTMISSHEQLTASESALPHRHAPGWLNRVLRDISTHPLVVLVVVSGGLGITVSYNKIYLYHLVTGLGLLVTLLLGRVKMPRRAFRIWVVVVGSLLLWGILWPSVWEGPVRALSYLAVIFSGLGGVLLLYLRIRNESALRAAVVALVGVEFLNVIFGYLEVYDIYHLPSKTSWLLQAGMGQQMIALYTRMPSAFNINPNDYAIALFIPIVFGVAWVVKRYWGWRLMLCFLPLTIYIFLFTRSRAGALGLVVSLVVNFLWWQRRRIVMAVIVLGLGFGIVFSVVKFGSFGQAKDTLSVVTGGLSEEDYQLIKITLHNPEAAANFTYQETGSIGYRLGMMARAWLDMLQTRGLGLGPGGEVSLHDLYFETLANAGVIGLVALVGLLVWLIRGSFRLSRSSSTLLSLVGLGSLLFWCAFTIGSISLSSVFYFLPMYMMLGVSFSAFRLQKQGAHKG